MDGLVPQMPTSIRLTLKGAAWRAASLRELLVRKDGAAYRRAASRIADHSGLRGGAAKTGGDSGHRYTLEK
jgi:hypothetical protein